MDDNNEVKASSYEFIKLAYGDNSTLSWKIKVLEAYVAAAGDALASHKSSGLLKDFDAIIRTFRTIGLVVGDIATQYSQEKN